MSNVFITNIRFQIISCIITTHIPAGAHCIKLLPEKNSVYFNPSFFSYAKVNGKIILNGVFRFCLSFFSGKSFMCDQLFRHYEFVHNLHNGNFLSNFYQTSFNGSLLFGSSIPRGLVCKPVCDCTPIRCI